AARRRAGPSSRARLRTWSYYGSRITARSPHILASILLRRQSCMGLWYSKGRRSIGRPRGILAHRGLETCATREEQARRPISREPCGSRACRPKRDKTCTESRTRTTSLAPPLPVGTHIHPDLNTSLCLPAPATGVLRAR